MICALLCRGHVLLEDVPGTAKTVLARAIAQSIAGAHASRVQCTPDLQPTDVTGLSVYNQKEREFEFRPGPLFANIVLVDEINRAMPRTQSALLEAMAERQITADGESRPLPEPFLILATQNPLDHEGTFPLPEAQLDRFFLRTTLGYPSLDDELRVVQEQLHAHPLDTLEPGIDVGELRQIQAATEDVYIDPIIQRWLIELVRATRELEIVRVGASVRGSLALERAVARVGAHPRPVVRAARGRRGAARAGAGPPRAAEPVPPRRRRQRRRRRGRPGAAAASSSCRGRAPSSPPAERAHVTGERQTFPLLGLRRGIGVFGRAAHEHASRHRLRDGQLAPVPAERQHARDRLGRLRASLQRAQLGRVHRPRALRRGEPARRRLRRPASRDASVLAGAAVAAQAGGGGDGRAG